MKTIKSTIEQQIKKQIAGREIVPSRDLWSEIESQSAVKPSKSSYNWLLIAACLILTFSLGAVLFFNQENKPGAPSESRMQAVAKPAVQSPVAPVAAKQNAESTSENQGQILSEEDHPAVLKSILLKPEPKALARQEELPAIRQNLAPIISEISPIKPEKTMAQADSAKTQVKKKRYADPSTLLFSVEHKDVIEKTKGKSNVATIDLNGN